ncbi:MAG: metal-dependent hydrolase [Candidatus Thermoplasmatota archaeon]
MADWLTHTLIGWITGRTTKQDIALVVIGALLPDLTKLTLLFTWLGIYDHQFFDPLHLPIGALLVAGIIAVFFQDIKKAFLALSIGVTTHFLLDFFLVHTQGGIKLLFPFSWDGWQVYWYRSDDYRVTIVALVAALLVYGIYRYHEHKKTSES